MFLLYWPNSAMNEIDQVLQRKLDQGLLTNLVRAHVP
jgi:hypothetical protein